MNPKYTKTSNSEKDGSYVEYEITVNNIKIGKIEGAGNKEGEFISIIKIESGFREKGYGFIAFREMFNEIDKNFPITSIKSSWNMNDQYLNEKKSNENNFIYFLVLHFNLLTTAVTFM